MINNIMERKRLSFLDRYLRSKQTLSIFLEIMLKFFSNCTIFAVIMDYGTNQ